MTGQQLIDAIREHHLEDLEISYAGTGFRSGIDIEFEVSDIELPYPKYTDVNFNRPAHIYKSKNLKIYNDGSSECRDNIINTSE